MIQVIGGGFSGLLLAYYLKKQNMDVVIVENSPRLGGMIQSLQTPHGLVETAANSILNNLFVEEVAKDIGLELVPAKKEAKKRFIYRGGQLRRWPLSFLASLRVAAFLLYFFFHKKSVSPRYLETICAWGERVLGCEGKDFLLTPALTGIYAGDPKKLSASLILDRFFHNEHKLPRAKKSQGSVAPLHGMEDWIKYLKNWHEKHGTRFTQTPIETSNTITATPPHKTNHSAICGIEMLPLVSITAFFPQSSLDGFGVLFPQNEGFRALGILANHQIFPNRVNECASETWIFGGALDKIFIELSDAEMKKILLEERAKLWPQINMDQSLSIHITKWPQAIPHYTTELEKLLLHMNPDVKRKYFGTYLGDLGLGRLFARANELARSFS